MASKIKVDTLETADGTGTIALSNQLTGLSSASMPAGSVIQVSSTTKTDVFSTTSTGWVDLTGVSLTITPSSTSSKVLVSAFFNLGITTGYMAMARLARDGTGVLVGDGSGNRQRTTVAFKSWQNNDSDYFNISYLDSPSSTSAVTYKIQMKGESGNVAYVNRTVEDANNAGYGPRAACSITLQEIKG